MPRVKRGVPAHKRHKKVLWADQGPLGRPAPAVSYGARVDASASPTPIAIAATASATSAGYGFSGSSSGAAERSLL